MNEANVNNHEGVEGCVLPRIRSIELDVYMSFVSESTNLAEIAPDISFLTSELVNGEPKNEASRFFSQLLHEVEADLSDPEVGIAVIDIPESPCHERLDDAFWGVAFSLAFGANIFSLDKDRINGTPYTVYAASYEKADKLTNLGLSPVAPEAKLGFHSDGVLSAGGVCMPINIMLYNICIEYGRPGNFYWVPFSLWNDRETYMSRVGVGGGYNVRVTPSVYEVEVDQLEVVSPKQVTVPIFVPTDQFGTTLYLNGDVISRADGSPLAPNLISDLRHSLATNKFRFYVPQRPRRLILVRNVFGAHARDVFEEPNSEASYTRIFLRSVDEMAIKLMATERLEPKIHEK